MVNEPPITLAIKCLDPYPRRRIIPVPPPPKDCVIMRLKVVRTPAGFTLGLGFQWGEE